MDFCGLYGILFQILMDDFSAQRTTDVIINLEMELKDRQLIPIAVATMAIQ